MTHRSFSARADIESILASLDAPRVDVAVLQPADPFLDTAGEELRRRIFMTADEAGKAMCLRPEFTIPVCRAHLKATAPAARYGYVGTVFRQRRQGGNEFLQAGIEDIGNRDEAVADARSLADAAAMLHSLDASAKTQMLLGDQSIFDAVLEALALPRGWRLQLAHAFGNAGALDAALTNLATPPAMPKLEPDVSAALAQGQVALTEIVSAKMLAASTLNSGGRTPTEIAQRLIAKAAAAHATPDPKKLELLRKFLAINVPLSQALAALDSFAGQFGITLNGNRDRFAARVKAIAAAGLKPSSIIYDASFGRPLDYYTGLVFEIRDESGEVLVGGGRYDRLLTMLGAIQPVPGIGFSVWLDRVAQTAGDGQ